MGVGAPDLSEACPSNDCWAGFFRFVPPICRKNGKTHDDFDLILDKWISAMKTTGNPLTSQLAGFASLCPHML